MPAGFAPDDGHRAFAAEHRLDLGAEFEAFSDFHRAKGSTFLDWPAALRTWLRNAVKFRRDHPSAPRSSGSAAARDLVEELEARDRARGYR